MKTPLTICLLWVHCIAAFAQNAPNKLIVSSANDFLKLLDQSQLEKISYAYDAEERFNWYFVPKARNGLMLRDMNEKQKEAAMNLLKATLSQQGHEKAIAIIQLEIILKELEKAPPESDYRSPVKYYFTIFGTPDEKKLWGWRIEGHHLSMNFSSESGKIVSATPLFFGSNPGIVPSGEKKGYQILKDEVNFGFELLNSFTPEQLQRVIISETAPGDIITSNKRKVNALANEGITFADMNQAQQKIFLRLLSVYVKNYPLGFSNELMQKIEKAGLNQLRFVWAGGKKYGENNGHYYRIQNDVILIEYDNTQNNGNHIHTVTRDLTNDFGEDILKKHYQQEHVKK
ncbi:DUF3500 domain-containing protein [Emticicia sp. C21]|uniref:DUF3500 domain-containing protein n=1 Tax=Emticicia sp. C21 TaxID=2302915 RepID=UPI000E346E46|nr:DUF3500 domain-containing protein [Emticicia sp. C21]RFS14913.1 DUF3500 domain-containing protein [Emticicia sp. C21]